MVGWLREPRRPWRIVSPSLTVGAFVLGACDATGPATSTPSAGMGGMDSSGSGGRAQSAGGSIITPGGSISFGGNRPACVSEAGAAPVFRDQAFDRLAPFQRELFTWTTPEQIAEIRAQGQLLTRTERAGLGPGFAVTRLAEFAAAQPEGETADLARLLTSEPFARARYAWPNPWATRMGWPGETYGGRLVRMLLREEARLAIFARNTLTVIDANQVGVPLATALAEPERIVGFFFIKDFATGGPECGSFGGGGNTYREFIIGNEAMIAEYSFGTEDILARLEGDIARLETFFERIRACPERRSAVDWNLDLGCSWPSTGQTTEQGAYEAALAMPSPGYLPASAPLAELIATLRGDLFTPDPFIVRPGG